RGFYQESNRTAGWSIACSAGTGRHTKLRHPALQERSWREPKSLIGMAALLIVRKLLELFEPRDPRRRFAQPHRPADLLRHLAFDFHQVQFSRKDGDLFQWNRLRLLRAVFDELLNLIIHRRFGDSIFR